MAIRAGHKVTVADFDFAGVYALKTTAETVTSSTTLQNDDELFCVLAANAKYAFDAFIEYDGPTAADIKFAFTVPSGAVINWVPAGARGGTSTTSFRSEVVGTSGTAAQIACVASGTPQGAISHGFLTTGSTSGNQQFQFAQFASNATAVKVYDFSWLRVFRVA
jgi:hypothetical protein